MTARDKFQRTTSQSILRYVRLFIVIGLSGK
jgi:hypothetical protein